MGHEWDGWMRNDIPRYYKEGTDILDIGANIGYNSLMFSDYGPVVSFEPMFHEIVIKNAEVNTFTSPYKYISDVHYQMKRKLWKCSYRSHGCQSNSHINYGGSSFHTGREI